jgi:hypothetical protein
LRRRAPVAGPGAAFRVAEWERSVEVDVRREESAIEGLGEAIVDIAPSGVWSLSYGVDVRSGCSATSESSAFESASCFDFTCHN